jgi:competence protein ComEC
MKINELIYSIFIYFVLFVPSFSIKGDKVSPGLNIYFWDVGQGDATYIVTPNGNRILIDGGDNYEVDFNLAKLVPFFSCKLDAIILTHPHYDHIKGLSRIMSRCKIPTVMFNDVEFTSRDFSYFKDLSKKFNVLNAYQGDEFVIDGVTFKILWPTIEFMQTKIKDINETSVVVLLDYGNFEALLLGDAGSQDLAKVDLNSIKPLIDGDLEVLKVPHHGSKFGLNKAFYGELKPKNCIISVGKDNKFGHPSKEVVEYLSDTGCNVMRTDIDGDITVTHK